MKTKNLRFISNLILMVLAPFLAEAQYQKSFTENFPAKTALTIEHERGNLTVEKATDNQLRYELNISFHARSDEDAARVMEAIQVTAQTSGDRRTLSTTTNIRGIVTINDRTTLQLADGSKVRGVKDLNLHLVVYTPALNDLEIIHKYNDVRVAGNLTKDLKATLRSCEINLGAISGHLILDAKYTKGRIGKAGPTELTLYDCDLTLDDLGDTKLSSKYSKLEAGQFGKLEATIYDDDLEIKQIDGALTLTDKYSEIAIEQCGNARLDVYDSQISINKGGNLRVKSKYTEFDLGKMYVLDFELSYDDEVQVAYATSLQVATSKYTSYEIEQLSKRLDIQSYDDEIRIDYVSSQFEALAFQGKYTTLELGLPGNLAYRLRADTKYGDLEVNEDAFDFQIWQEKNDTLKAEGRTKNASDSSPLFTINGYDNNIRIK